MNKFRFLRTIPALALMACAFVACSDDDKDSPDTDNGSQESPNLTEQFKNKVENHIWQEDKTSYNWVDTSGNDIAEEDSPEFSGGGYLLSYHFSGDEVTKFSLQTFGPSFGPRAIRTTRKFSVNNESGAVVFVSADGSQSTEFEIESISDDEIIIHDSFDVAEGVAYRRCSLLRVSDQEAQTMWDTYVAQ